MRLASRRAAIGWWLLFAFLCFMMLVIGTETALHFVGPAIDGPFQLYNSLRRIWVGQRGGVDFQFFHGLGIPFLHYPMFRLLGGTFIASEITRQLMSVIIYPLVLVAFLQFFIRDWTRVAAWCAIVMAASIAFRMTSLLVAINSLLGIRSTLPTLLPIALCLPVKRWTRVTVTGVALGLALIMGTEQGLAALMALAIATVVIAIRSRERAVYAVDAAAEIGIGVATLVALLVAIGGVEGMRTALVYNFKLIPMDQYWYFGAPPNHFLGSWRSMPAMLNTIPRIPLTILTGVVVVVLCARQLVRGANATAERERFAFTVLALYGLISCTSLLGTYVHAYVQPLLRVLLLIGAVSLDRVFPARDERLERRPWLGVSPSMVQLTVATVAFMFTTVSPLNLLLGTMPHFVSDHLIKRQGAVYAGIWPETMVAGQALLDAHRHPDGTPPTLWSTYAGLLEARNGLFQPNFDYIIHALGPANRKKYVDEFSRLQPELVQTVMPTYTQYESWIEETSWDFYRELLQHYTVIGNTEWSFMWQRTPAAMPAPQMVWSAAVPAGATSLDLPAPPGNGGGILLEAELTYRVRNPLHVLPVIGATPRYLVDVQNAVQAFPVTLDPYVTVSRFPILGIRGKAPRLAWQTFSLLPGASIEVTNVKLSFVPIAGANLKWLENLYQRQSGNAPEQ
ncbi:MAG: hypothetical protein ACREPM_14860 [Gemmatimonadaceae bacterium]